MLWKSQFHIKTHVYEHISYAIIIPNTVHEFVIKSLHETELNRVIYHTTQLTTRNKFLLEVKGNLYTLSWIK